MSSARVSDFAALVLALAGLAGGIAVFVATAVYQRRTTRRQR